MTKAGFHWRNRLFEWTATLMMLGLAIEIGIWPGTVGASAFRYMLQVIDPGWLSIFFFIVGILRVGALYANGASKVYGPRVRSFTALGAALIWGQMFAALLLLAPHVGIPSPGLPVYFALTVGEIISAYRAATDVGKHR